MLYLLSHFQSDSGGMVSPAGLSFIGRSKEGLGGVPAAIAIKRTHLDEAIAKAAKRLALLLDALCDVYNHFNFEKT